MKKSQSSIEAALVMSFMLIALSIFIGVIVHRGIILREEAEVQTLVSIADLIKAEIFFAEKAEDGYIREFTLPRSVDGIPFRVQLLNASLLNPGNPQHSELLINATEYKYDLFHVEIMPKSLFGEFCNNDTHYNKVVRNGEQTIVSCVEI